jgi:hypothetical protein
MLAYPVHGEKPSPFQEKGGLLVMPAPARPTSSFSPTTPPFAREGITSSLPRPVAGAAGASRTAVLSERDLMADLEPHWAAAIDAATV